MSRSRLSEEEIQAALAEVPAWTRQGEEIERVWKFTDFAEAMKFVNRVADLAEAADHHPDITIVWNRVTLRLSTHDRGGLTGLDFSLAKQIDAVSV